MTIVLIHFKIINNNFKILLLFLGWKKRLGASTLYATTQWSSDSEAVDSGFVSCKHNTFEGTLAEAKQSQCPQ